MTAGERARARRTQSPALANLLKVNVPARIELFGGLSGFKYTSLYVPISEMRRKKA